VPMTFTMAAPGTVLPPAAAKPRIPLAPVVKTLFRQTRRGRECFGAETTDGVWGFDRMEDTTTSWMVVHAETKTVVADFFGSLKGCRMYVASGQADEDLCRVLAHKRGEHSGDGRDLDCWHCDIGGTVHGGE
jgi:predicted lipid carrier protein YhbT